MGTEKLVDLNYEHSQPSIEKASRKKKKRGLRVLIGLTIALIIVVILVGTVSAYSDEVLIHPARMPVTTNPGKYGLRYQNVSFLSRVDHIQLSGWFIPALSLSDRTIIMAHGHAANRTQMLPMVPAFVNHGYNIFAFDFRDSGESILLDI